MSKEVKPTPKASLPSKFAAQNLKIDKLIKENIELQKHLSSTKALVCAILSKMPAHYVKITKRQLDADYTKSEVRISMNKDQDLVTIRLK